MNMGKYVLLDKIAYRYAFDHVDQYALALLEKIIDRNKEFNYSYRPANFYQNPLDYLLYFELKFCENTLTYIYNNVNGQTKERIKMHLKNPKRLLHRR